jgi:hypothetical protein
VGEHLGDISLILKEGMDARTELEKVANLLNGYQTLMDGALTPLPGFVPKTINLISE